MDILILIFLILLNGVFAMSEIAVISARRARLQQLSNEGNAGARVALELADDPNQFLATVQVGITLVGILAGAFGSAALADQFATFLSRSPLLAPYAPAISLALIVLFITYFSLVIGELVPKRIALLRAESLAALLAPAMRRLSVLAAPVVRVLSFSTELILLAFGIRPGTSSSVTEEEVKLMIEEGTQVGVFEPMEEEMVHQVFLLADQTVADLMTPRTDLVWLNLDDPPGKIQQQIATSHYSQFPVARDNLDHLLGLVHAKDLLAQIVDGQSLAVDAVLQPPIYVPGSVPAFRMLAQFQETHSHVAFVIGEYGELLGLITAHDIVEAIVGDLPEAREEPEIVQRADGSWLVDGRLPIYELKELLDVDELPAEDVQDFRTLGGFVMTYLGRIPAEGDGFDWAGFRFEVVDMDRNRVDKVLINHEL